MAIYTPTHSTRAPADLIRDIKDPEHPHTLEELSVVRESLVSVRHLNSVSAGSSGRVSEQERGGRPDGGGGGGGGGGSEEEELWIRIDFTPTVPHCSLAALIGLCLRVKLERCLTQQFKLDIFVTEGTHSVEEDVNRQINDKERVAAAMENPSLREMVEECIREPEY